MSRALVCAALALGFAASLTCAQQDRTFTVQVGSFPWYDRVGVWAISELPAQYAGDRPVPQQSCTERSLVLPEEGVEEVLIGVLASEVAQFLAQFPALADTGDRLEIGKGANTLSYAICVYADPPRETSFAFSTAGVMLLSWPGELPAAATAQPDEAAVYVPADGACPWHDRVGRWVIRDLPEQFADGPPVPLQSCGDRTLILPEGTTAVTIAIFADDLPGFREQYPQVQDTGQGLTIASPGGGAAGLAYRIITFPDPPREGHFKDFTTGGIVLLSLEGTEAPAVAPAGEAVSGVLEQDQEFVAQQRPGVEGERTVRMWVQEPPGGITPNTGLMLVLHNWGGEYNQPAYLQWCRTFAERYNVVAISVNYLHSGPAWQDQLPYDHGYLQAMDCIGALYTLLRQLTEAGVAFNEHRIYAMGGSGGGNVTQMAMKLAPHSFACGVDICGMPGLIDAIAYGTGEGTQLNAGYSREPGDPNYLSPDMQRIRDFGDPEHCRLLAAANPGLQIVIVHGLGDASCPPVPKIRQFANMIEAELDVDAHFLTPIDVDGAVITTTGHAVGDREQVVIRYADAYMLEDGALARATSGPSDFTRGGSFEYPTEGGRFVIDFSGYPTISFVANEPAG